MMFILIWMQFKKKKEKKKARAHSGGTVLTDPEEYCLSCEDCMREMKLAP